MKKLFSIMLLLAMTITAWAETFESGDIAYEVLTAPSGSTRGTVMCTGLSSTGRSTTSLKLLIPYLVSNGSNNYYVTTIGASAFSGCTNIANVNIRYGVLYVNQKSFYGCTSMSYVGLPSSIKSIDSNAFGGCTNLKNVYCAALDPSTITTYGNAFPAATATLNIPWGADFTAYRSRAAFAATIFPTIKHSSEAYDYSLSNGTFCVVSKAPTTSDNGEFTIIGFNINASGTTGELQLSKSTRPSSHDKYYDYVAVADSAFYGNTNLTSIDFSNVTALRTFGHEAAKGCTNLASVKLVAGEVEARAFSGCTSLSSVTLDGVTKLDDRCFYGCTSLKTITIPASITSVSPYFIDRCSNLNKIIVDTDNNYYSAYDGALYNKAKTILYRVPEGVVYNFASYPSTMLTVGAYSHENCTNLKSVTLPYGVKTVRNYAFNNCSSLQYATIPSSVTSLGVYVFSKCTSLADVYVNTRSAPTINKDEFFQGASSSINLHTQRSMENAFKNAGWTGFASYNKDDVVAYDARDSFNLCYTVSSTEPTTVDETSFTGGRVKVVRGRTADQVNGGIAIQRYLTINGKTYAVSRIDTLAFNTTNSISISGCQSVDTVAYRAFAGQAVTDIELPYVSVIEDYAFYNCTSLTKVDWRRNLKRIEGHAFEGATALTQDIIFPVGFKFLGYRALSGVKSSRILIPSTISILNGSCFYGMSSLEEMYVNGHFYASNNSFDFTGVPTSCKVYVPVGNVAMAQAHSNWSRFTSIQAGAFDFAYNASFKSLYKMTVTSTTPVTVGGVTYDGKAKYVYTSNIASSSYYSPSDYESDKMLTSEKKYLMTEIGDSCFARSGITTFNFKEMTRLSRIGRKAFYASLLTSADLPANVISFGEDAFYNAMSLTEIVTRASITYDGQFFGNNANDFNLFVPNDKVYKSLNSTLQNHTFNQAYTCADRVAPCFTTTATTYPLAVQSNLNFEASDVTAYKVKAFDSSSNTATSGRMYRAGAGEAVILTGLTPGNFYKIKRYYGTQSTSTNYLKPVSETTNIYNVSNAYYWDSENLKFVKATSKYNVPSGQAYLLASGGGSEVYLDLFPSSTNGDLNGDGIVDITDVNMAINMVLGKATKTTAADVNGDGEVDITDVNAIINLMLGK